MMAAMMATTILLLNCIITVPIVFETFLHNFLLCFSIQRLYGIYSPAELGCCVYCKTVAIGYWEKGNASLCGRGLRHGTKKYYRLPTFTPFQFKEVMECEIQKKEITKMVFM